MEHANESPRHLLRAIAFCEGCTLALLLFVAVPLKHLAGEPGAVRVLGPVHGLAFSAYVWALMRAWAASELPPARLPRLLCAALLPFGAFVLLRGARRK